MQKYYSSLAKFPGPVFSSSVCVQYTTRKWKNGEKQESLRLIHRMNDSELDRRCTQEGGTQLQKQHTGSFVQVLNPIPGLMTLAWSKSLVFTSDKLTFKFRSLACTYLNIGPSPYIHLASTLCIILNANRKGCPMCITHFTYGNVSQIYKLKILNTLECALRYTIVFCACVQFGLCYF